MKLTEPQLAKFRELYKQHFGVELTPEEAIALAQSLLLLVQIGIDPNNDKDPPKNET